MEESIAVEIERIIIELMDNKRKEMGLSDAAWGTLAYPESKDPRRKIQSVKNPQSNGKPQRLNVGDMIRMAQPLGLEPSRLIAKALDEKNI